VTPEQVLQELWDREPIFHRREHGSARADFDALMAPDYWEVGASGRVYSRADVLDVLESRYADPAYDPIAGHEVTDFACRAVGGDVWLATYHLRQGDRDTRRVTVWRNAGGRWVPVYHQGTVIAV